MRSRDHRIAEILSLVSAISGVAIVDIKSQARPAKFAKPRQVVMYLTRRWTEMSCTVIARELGSRDHTTILYGARRIASQIEADLEIRKLVEEAERCLAHAYWPMLKSSPPPLPRPPKCRKPVFCRQTEPTKPTQEKQRKCIMTDCGLVFTSHHFGERYCPSCRKLQQGRNRKGHCDPRYLEAAI